MNDVNILEEKPKMKGGFKALLIVLVVLLLVAGGCGAYFYFTKSVSSPKAIYARIINDFGNSMVKAIDSVENMQDLNSGKMEVTATLSSSDQELKEIADIVNKLKLSFDYETDKEKKVINLKALANYDNKDVISPNVYVRGNDVFVEESSLFNKAIKFSGNDLNMMWGATDYKGVKVVIEELTKIAKDNLSDDYFTEEKVSNDQTKITLTLDKKNLEKYTKAVISDIKNNKKLLNELVNILDKDRETIIKDLEGSIKDVKFSDEFKTIIETYVNKKTNTIERVIFDVSGLSVIFDKKDDVKYDIQLSMGGQKISIGSLTIKDNLFSLNINVEGLVAEYTISSAKDNTEMTIAFEYGDIKVKYKQNGTAEKGSMTLDVKFEDLSGMVNINYSASNSKADTKAITDYVDSDKLTEEDEATIYGNAYKNEVLKDLISNMN